MSLQNFMDLSDCTLCPRSCRVNRLAGRIGYCNVTADLFAARAALYYHEEPVISGSRGSGAVFFAGCNMGCVFCQNYAIAKAMTGTQLSSGRLTEIFLSLQEQGAHNINLITAEHFLPQVIRSLRDAKDQGLTLPVVYNTGTYERVEAIQALEGLVDVWLPDFKYISPRLSLAYSHTPDYFQYASKALAEMVRQCPRPLFADGTSSIDAEDDADDPVMVRGVIVRHLALPGCAEDSRDILDYLHTTYGDNIFISLMNQYTPMPQVWGDPNLGRKLTPEEYDSLVDYAISIGITNGFIQDGETASQSYIPAFDGTGL
jgi:putative pyruvate formate lyase activating enzyme